MAKSTCVIDGCEKPVNAKGLCSRHYNRMMRYGDPLAGGHLREKLAKGELCTVPDCGLMAAVRKLCNAHYLRWYRHGDLRPDVPIAQAKDLMIRFWSSLQVQATGCWTWKVTRGDGYGRIHVDGQRRLAHIFSFETFAGAVPQGKELDHLCRNRACVNPSHLEPVTHAENILRGMAPGIVSSRTGMCKKGLHLTSGANLYINPGTGARSCRECMRKARRDKRARGK